VAARATSRFASGSTLVVGDEHGDRDGDGYVEYQRRNVEVPVECPTACSPQAGRGVGVTSRSPSG
jgi:hypothetical protein